MVSKSLRQDIRYHIRRECQINRTIHAICVVHTSLASSCKTRTSRILRTQQEKKLPHASKDTKSGLRTCCEIIRLVSDNPYYCYNNSILFIALVVIGNVEVPQLVHISVLVGCNYLEPIHHIVLLQVLLLSST